MFVTSLSKVEVSTPAEELAALRTQWTGTPRPRSGFLAGDAVMIGEGGGNGHEHIGRVAIIDGDSGDPDGDYFVMLFTPEGVADFDYVHASRMTLYEAV